MRDGEGQPQEGYVAADPMTMPTHASASLTPRKHRSSAQRSSAWLKLGPSFDRHRALRENPNCPVQKGTLRRSQAAGRWRLALSPSLRTGKKRGKRAARLPAAKNLEPAG